MSASSKDDTFKSAIASIPSQGSPWLESARELANIGPAWMRALRTTASAAFASTGLPTVAAEGWQYTNLRPLIAMSPQYTADPACFDVAKIPANLLRDSGRIVIVNGQYQPHMSIVPPGVSVFGLLQAAENDADNLEHHLVNVGDFYSNPLQALNTTYLRDGMALYVEEKAIVEQPVEVIFYTTDEGKAVAPVVYPRVFYNVGNGAQITIIERHVGGGVYAANSQIDIALKADSLCKFYRFMQESPEAFHYSLTAVHQEKNSSFEGFSMASGGVSARQEYHIKLLDSVISASIGGVYLLKNQQCHDFTVVADHFEPNGTSVQRFKGVIDDQARAVFQGKIHVRRSAQKTDGYQSHHAILLSGQAEASFKPELEIYADDVKCSHGAATGQIDPAALFYLRSRGISEKEARALMLESFLNEAVQCVSHESIRNVYASYIHEWLGGVKE